MWIWEGHEKFIPEIYFKRTRQRPKKKKRSSSQNFYKIRCESTKIIKIQAINTNLGVSGLDLHSNSLEPVNFFGAQSSVWGGHSPEMLPRCAGPGVRQKVRSDRRLTDRMIADELMGTNSERVWSIITEDLGMRKIWAKMVPRLLNEGHKEMCASVSRHFGATPNWTQLAEKSCYWRWVIDLRVRSTHQTAESWMEERIVTKTPKGESVHLFKSKTKVMLISFFDVHGIVLAEFLPQGQTINQHVYKNILLRRLMLWVREKRREPWETRSWLLHHDNAPANNALGIREFLAENNIAVLEQPPYSPDLDPCDFFLFPKLKEVIKGTRFHDSKVIKTAVKREPRAIPEESF